jgi:hypothetical protein
VRQLLWGSAATPWTLGLLTHHGRLETDSMLGVRKGPVQSPWDQEMSEDWSRRRLFAGSLCPSMPHLALAQTPNGGPELPP